MPLFEGTCDSYHSLYGCTLGRKFVEGLIVYCKVTLSLKASPGMLADF